MKSHALSIPGGDRSRKNAVGIDAHRMNVSGKKGTLVAVSEMDSFAERTGTLWAKSIYPGRSASSSPSLSPSSLAEIMRDGMVLTHVVDTAMSPIGRRLSNPGNASNSGMMKASDQASAKRRLSTGLRYISEHYSDLANQLPHADDVEKGDQAAATQLLHVCLDITLRRVRAQMQRMLSWYAKFLAPYGINMFGLASGNKDDAPSAPITWRAFRTGVPFACAGGLVVLIYIPVSIHTCMCVYACVLHMHVF